MEEVDFSQLEIPVGRPEEHTIIRKDLSDYSLEPQFQRNLNKFFNFWYEVVKRKSEGVDFYVHAMENFYGEILDKFGELHIKSQRDIVNRQISLPFKYISDNTNLRLPNVFPIKEDSDSFIDIFKEYSFVN